MYPILLIDFGSTYTKTTVVDLDQQMLMQTAQSFTTVDTDIRHGLEAALADMGTTLDSFREVYACSSAAGGLRMAVSGLMPELTAKAAHMAALGAGAKVVRTFRHELTRDDLSAIEQLRPDIFLLCGGTDGGNRRCIEHNAHALASIQTPFPILFAGNRSAEDTCRELLKEREVYYCPNVLPSLNVIHIEPVQEVIRSVFHEKIVQGKGLSEMNSLLDRIAMPTPSAVQTALELLSKGTERQNGIGELIGIDIGGATTDVYSMAKGDPQDPNVVVKSLPEPFSKRTVEGDIGMRYSLSGIVDEAGLQRLAETSGLPVETVSALLHALQEEKSLLPRDEEAQALDFALAKEAVTTAMRRHAGQLETMYTPLGRQYLQSGKDLRGVGHLILTGGALLHTSRLREMIADCLYTEDHPNRLLPRRVRIQVDNRYILSAMGVLSKKDPDAALTILKKELRVDRDTQS